MSSLTDTSVVDRRRSGKTRGTGVGGWGSVQDWRVAAGGSQCLPRCYSKSMSMRAATSLNTPGGRP